MPAPIREDDSQVCFGFTIRSARTFRFLRKGGGQDPLDVLEATQSIAAPQEALLFEWKLRDPSGAVTARLYRKDGVFHFWTSDAGWYRVDPVARTIEMAGHADKVRSEQRLWGVPTALCVKEQGGVVLHAAAVEVDGAAILLAAPGRFGKTTLALAFHREGYRLLSEDTACCTLDPRPLLFPGPTSVRLRPDMFDGQSPPGTTVIEVRRDRVHLTLDADRCGDGRPVPIRGLVFLRESPDKIFVERVEASKALPDLWTLALRFRSDAERGQSFSRLAQLAATVPVWNLYRPLQVIRLDEVVRRLVETCR